MNLDKLRSLIEFQNKVAFSVKSDPKGVGYNLHISIGTFNEYLETSKGEIRVFKSLDSAFSVVSKLGDYSLYVFPFERQLGF